MFLHKTDTHLAVVFRQIALFYFRFSCWIISYFCLSGIYQREKGVLVDYNNTEDRFLSIRRKVRSSKFGVSERFASNGRRVRDSSCTFLDVGRCKDAIKKRVSGFRFSSPRIRQNQKGADKGTNGKSLRYLKMQQEISPQGHWIPELWCSFLSTPFALSNYF